MDIEMGGTPHLPIGYDDLNSPDSNASLRGIVILLEILHYREMVMTRSEKSKHFFTDQLTVGWTP